MELSVYKRQIAFGSAASVAFLAAGVLAAGTAYASTIPASTAGSVAAASPSAVVSSLPSLSTLRGTVKNDVGAVRGALPATGGVVRQEAVSGGSAAGPVSTPMQHVSALVPVTSAVPGAGMASGLLNTATGVAQQVPGLQGSPNSVGVPTGSVAKLPGVSLGGSSIGQAAKSLMPGQLSGTVKNVTAAEKSLPGGANLPTLGGIESKVRSVGTSASSIAQQRASLSGAASPLSTVTGALPGVAGLLNGAGINGLPVSGIPLAG